jgi:hypothetical protein
VERADGADAVLVLLTAGPSSSAFLGGRLSIVGVRASERGSDTKARN